MGRPRNGPPRPMRTVPWQRRTDSAERGRAKSHKDSGPAPSDLFDWDTALLLACRSLRDLGYQLTPQQQRRIDDHA